MPDQPRFTLRVIGDEPNGRLVMEPAGGEYELPSGTRLRVDVYGRSVGTADVGADVEIEHTPGRTIIWLVSTDYRIWDEAGTEITNQAL